MKKQVAKEKTVKKQINKNLIFSLSLAGILFLVVVFGVILALWLSSGLNELHGEIGRMSSRDEIGDVEGYGIIVDSIGYGLGTLGKIMLWIFGIFIPSIMAFYIFIFAIIARFIYKETPGRIQAYRILMGFSFSGQILLLVETLSFVKVGGWMSLVDLLISAYIFFAIFQGMRGTYTDRIKPESMLQ